MVCNVVRVTGRFNAAFMLGREVAPGFLTGFIVFCQRDREFNWKAAFSGRDGVGMVMRMTLVKQRESGSCVLSDKTCLPSERARPNGVCLPQMQGRFEFSLAFLN